jgi:hypothetical protein
MVGEGVTLIANEMIKILKSARLALAARSIINCRTKEEQDFTQLYLVISLRLESAMSIRYWM